MDGWTDGRTDRQKQEDRLLASGMVVPSDFEKKKIYPCYRPWRPIGLREVKAPTLLRLTANRWRQGCQPYAPAAHYFQVSLIFKISVTQFC
jgi:hypothetical protein